jgi:hypothetical protein
LEGEDEFYKSSCSQGVQAGLQVSSVDWFSAQTKIQVKFSLRIPTLTILCHRVESENFMNIKWKEAFLISGIWSSGMILA